MSQSQVESEKPIFIDINDPDQVITPEILLEHNNPFNFSAKNAGGYEKTGINIDPESLRGLYRFETFDDAVALQLRVLERSGRETLSINDQTFNLQTPEGKADYMKAKAVRSLIDG